MHAKHLDMMRMMLEGHETIEIAAKHKTSRHYVNRTVKEIVRLWCAIADLKQFANKKVFISEHGGPAKAKKLRAKGEATT
jgi:hypothetical protein